MSRATNRSFPSSRVAVAVAVVIAAGAAAGIAAALATRGHTNVAPVYGVRVDRPVPNVPLLDERGRHVSLADFRGKIVVLSPVLTLCHEVCPLTTGAFMSMERTVRDAGLGGRVVFAEISVDPWRDSPARLRAFRRYTGIDLTLLTGTEQSLRRFWHFFGVAFFKTPEGRPPDVDWWTHEPQTFDVAHSDGVFFVDASGHLRIVVLGMPNVHGRLAARLRGLLSAQGMTNLMQPEAPWTVPQALDDLSSLAGRRISATG
jgi:cytochrome oxidase Cu insertion factor (SCO1/SenC/PrrC family)